MGLPLEAFREENTISDVAKDFQLGDIDSRFFEKDLGILVMQEVSWEPWKRKLLMGLWDLLLVAPASLGSHLASC